ncbi:MAG TPA: cytochrome c biogenesis protein CcdA [Micromonosporaceae bacterium]|nr:cytochrome c biogenesis protein CcdA [Micromonosporaceae bacterium]
MGEAFAEIAAGGPLLFAVGVAALAGLASFLSPCVLPLVPGYLSYVTGLAGADLDDGRRRGRVLAGTLLFVAGFTVVFTLTGVLAAGVGTALLVHGRAVQAVIGALTILLGLAFLGLVPGLQREWRLRVMPNAGLAGAPVFGAVFALGWVPCVGPTLGAVLGLATVGGQPARGAVLGVAYCLGLGVPFVAFGLGFRRLIGVFGAVRRNSRWVTRAGGALLVLVGLALVTDGWTELVNWLRTTVGVGEVPL